MSARGDAAWNEAVAPLRRDVTMGGYTLHVIDPRGSGAPVILVHGYADTTYSWHQNFGALSAAGLRPILVDQPGFGRSGAPRRHVFGVENQARLIVDLADRLGLETFSVAGHSMGGGIALYLCLRFAGRVARAAVLAPVTKRPGRRLALEYPGVGFLAEHVAGRVEAARRLILASALRQVYHDRSLVTPTLVAEYSRGADRGGYWRDLARLTRQFFSAEFDVLVHGLEDIQLPVAILWGRQDRWLSPRRAPFLQRAIPGARLEIIEEAGHNLHQERPDLVNASLIDFFCLDGYP